jgi:hypothetical protein
MMIPVRVLRGRLRYIVGLGRKLRSIRLTSVCIFILSRWLASRSSIRRHKREALPHLAAESRYPILHIRRGRCVWPVSIGRRVHKADMLTRDAWRGEILMRWLELKSAAEKTEAHFGAAPPRATLRDHLVGSRTDQKRASCESQSEQFLPWSTNCLL